MQYFNLRPDFITELSHNNLARLLLPLVIFNCIRISDCPKQAQDLNAVLFHILLIALITLPFWSICKMVCYFNANSNNWFNLSEVI